MRQFISYGKIAEYIDNFCNTRKAEHRAYANTDYNGYIYGESHEAKMPYAIVTFHISYYRHYPSEFYARHPNDPDTAARNISSVRISIQARKDCNEDYEEDFYGASIPVLDAVLPFFIDTLDEYKKSWEKEQAEQEKAEEAERHKQYLKLKEEFEPDSKNAKK